MKRGTIFWGAVLILLGALFLLSNLGILTVDIWKIAWPLLLVLFGLWILFGSLLGRRAAVSEHANVPLEGAARARIRIGHGAGRLALSSGANGGDLVTGDFVGGLDVKTRHNGDLLDVELNVPARSFPFGPWDWGFHGFNWDVQLNREIPTALDFNTGAGESKVDLTDLIISDLQIHTGASSSTFNLPANARQTRVVLEAGAASVVFHVPQGVAVRIRNQSGLSSLNVDKSRFPRQGDFYLSPDFDGAANRIDMEIRTGIGSVEVI